MSIVFSGVLITVMAATPLSGSDIDPRDNISLPQPIRKTELSVEESLAARRSVRHFTKEPIALDAVAQLLWAAQGVTSSRAWRTAPSAGALFPLELYVVAAGVSGIDSGIYKYDPTGHTLALHVSGDLRQKLANAALRQDSVKEAPATVVITAVYRRTARKYGPRTKRYVHMEVGHAAQNVYLQAQSLALGTVILGAFDDRKVHRVLNLPREESPLALMPVGHPRK